jgi:hypothetical protein
MPETSAEVEREVAYIRSTRKVNVALSLSSWRQDKAKHHHIRHLIALTPHNKRIYRWTLHKVDYFSIRR